MDPIIGGALISGGLGMLGQAGRARKQHQRQKELMGIQFENQKALNEQGQALQFDMWNKTNYGAQMKHMTEAGLNPGLMYGMSGGGGTTTGSQGGGSAQGGQAHAPMDIGAAVQVAKLLAETKLLEAQADNVKEDTNKKSVEQDSIRTGIDKLIAETNNENEKTALTRLQQALIQTDKQKREQEIQNLKSDKMLTDATRNLKLSETERTNAETAIKKFDVQTMEKYGISNVDSPLMKTIIRAGNLTFEEIVKAIEFMTGIKAGAGEGFGGAKTFKD